MIVRAAALALLVGLLRWWFPSTIAGSAVLLWAATALVALLLLVGLGRCLGSIFRGEPDEGRARAGAIVGLVLVGAIVVYALTGGFAAIERARGAVAVEPGEPARAIEGPVEDGYEYRDLELRRYRYEDFRFRIEAPATPYELRGEDRVGWDFGVRVVVDMPGVRDDAIFEVYAEEREDAANVDQMVEDYLIDLDASYEWQGEIISARPGRLNGSPCAVVNARYAGEANAEPVRTRLFWVPGDGYVYLVRVLAFEDDWPRARGPLMEIVERCRWW